MMPLTFALVVFLIECLFMGLPFNPRFYVIENNSVCSTPTFDIRAGPWLGPQGRDPNNIQIPIRLFKTGPFKIINSSEGWAT